MGCSLKNREETDDITVDTPNQKDQRNQKYINKTLPKKSIVNYGDENIDRFSQFEIQLCVQGPTPLQIIASIDDSVNSLKSILSRSLKFQSKFYGEESNRMVDSTSKKRKVRFSSKIEVNQFINSQQYRKKIVTMKSLEKLERKQT